MAYIRVALDVPLPQLFDYACAEATPAHVGLRVRVPFGPKELVGVIMEVAAAPSCEPDRVRSAHAILTDAPALPAELLRLIRFCAAYYHHPVGEVVMAALPARYRTPQRVRKAGAIAITDAGREALGAGQQRAPVAAAVLERLDRASGPIALEEFAAAERRALRRLLERGWVRPAEPAGETPSQPAHAPEGLVLTAEQGRVVAAICSAKPGFKVWLLHGITGSGKTEVYLAVMAEVLARGGQALLLVPEIGLTPQLEASVRARFPGVGLAILHSGLTDAVRARHWYDACRGRARIVLGTRSAVFAPLPQLALIIVDEEHDSSYKQNEGVRYSARDLAVWRARDRDVPIVLGSATPSLESYQRAAEGRYSTLRLTLRPNAAPLPSVDLVPIAGARIEGGIAPALLTAIRARLERQEQVLVFINRRGYAPVLLCTACAWAPTCPRCAAHSVLHKPQLRMLCHHCGFQEPVPVHCPQCGNSDLHPVGFGTQRIEATLRSALPGARLLRIDRDTTRARAAWPAMRDAIANRQVDVLIGTQLLSKGHDFAGISLVCVLNADRSLFSSDFRASEQLFAQLLQVAGRAGRGTLPGHVLIQTAFPTHPLYAAVRAHDYEAFARMLLEERRAAGLPPFVYQALLRAEATRLQRALDFLAHAAELAAAHAEGVTVYDPTPAALPRLQGRERAQLLVQSHSRAELHRFLDRWLSELWSVRATGARWVLDVDPMDI